MLTTNIINDSLDYDGHTKSDIISLTNRWKHLLKNKYNAEKGDKLAISIMEVNVNQIALSFAAAELGLILFILDFPVNPQTIHKTKLGLFGPVKFTVECDWLKSHPIHHIMVERYSENVLHEDDILNYYEECEDEFNELHTPYLLGSTSGTTSDSKPVLFTQNEVYTISKRNIDVFKFVKDDKVVHSKNMHHASSILTHLFPSLMASDNHRNIVMNPMTVEHISGWFADEIVKWQPTKMMMINMRCMDIFLKAIPKLDTTLLINMSGFTVPDYFVGLCEENNIEFISHFGSIDTGIPLLVNHVTKDSDWTKSSLGCQPDDFYTMELVDDRVVVNCELWPNKRLLGDQLNKKGNTWIHMGRDKKHVLDNFVSKHYAGEFDIVGEDLHLVLWEPTVSYDTDRINTNIFRTITTLNKKDFTTETKVNMDQLRGYLCTLGD